MVDPKLLEEVNQLGVSFVMPELKVDVNKTLADVVKSHEVRLWEHFPAVLASTASTTQLVDFQKVKSLLPLQKDLKAFQDLAAVSKALYDNFQVQFSPVNKALEKVHDDWKAALKPVQESLAQFKDVTVGDVNLSGERLNRFFEDYLKTANAQLRAVQVKSQELSLEYALSQVFSARQKELFKKKLKGEMFSKTEREYFSRTVKKKAQALANPDLHRLAQKVLE